MKKVTSKNLLLGLIFFTPLLFLIFFYTQPQIDPTANLPLFHFYIVTFTTFSAAVISIQLSLALRNIARPRHILAAVAFAVMGIIFLMHGLATPGALIDYLHPAISWSAWLTLLSGGLIFALAGFDRLTGLPTWLSVQRVTQLALVLVIFYLLLILFGPQWLEFLDANANPWHRSVIFGLTLGLWVFAVFALGTTWRVSGSRVDGVLVFVALWLAFATVSMHQFPVWQLSWWLYHFILLLGFLITVYVLLTEYEQLREFSLLRYYLTASLIATALLALFASYLYAEFSYRTLVREKEAVSIQLVNSIATETAANLSKTTSPNEALTTYAAQFNSYPIAKAIVYDTAGKIIDASEYGGGYYSSDSANTIPAAYEAGYDLALSGEASAELQQPEVDDKTNTYSPFGESTLIATYIPLYLTDDPTDPPIGAVVALQIAAGLVQATLQARTTSLIMTALIMGILFGILLLIVARADRIINARTQELTIAYANLQQAEGMRDDLTSMIIHDLRNPLSIIYGILGLLSHLNEAEHAEKRFEYIDEALTASERMIGLIGDILSVSKIEAGQLKPQLQVLVVDQLLSKHLKSFKAQAAIEKKNLTIECPANLNGTLDPNLIGRVVENLVSNALKHTVEGGYVQVSAWADNGQLRIRVRDDGMGIPDEYKQHIFKKFIQAPNATQKLARKGTGLGLAFCGLVVDLHGGQIWVEDAPNGGSDFILQMPNIKNI